MLLELGIRRAKRGGFARELCLDELREGPKWRGAHEMDDSQGNGAEVACTRVQRARVQWVEVSSLFTSFATPNGNWIPTDTRTQ